MNDLFDERVGTVKPAIMKMANKLARSSSMEYDDARQELLITVWKSHTKYKAGGGAKFSTFAIGCMINRTKTLLHKHNSKNHTISVENDVLDQLCEGNTAEQNNRLLDSMVLDAIEKVLFEKKSESVADTRAYTLFKMMRNGHSLLSCARKMDINQGWLSRIFNNKIRSLRKKCEGF